MSAGFLTDEEAPADLRRPLIAASRATRAGGVWVATERLPEVMAVRPDATPEPVVPVPASRASRAWTRDTALAELLRSRVTVLGPFTAAGIAASLGIETATTDEALLTLEAEGLILRGRFSPGPHTLSPDTVEWCDRRLLARIHRYTLNRLRAEIAPVSPADFMRHLFAWQHLTPASRLTGPDGLRRVVAQLDGLELPAKAWERDILPARIDGYQPGMLDMLCLTGDVGWARLSSGPTQVVGATPIALFLRDQADVWASLRTPGDPPDLTADATAVRDDLAARGASFRHEIAARTGLDDGRLRAALEQLASTGLVTSDGFAGLRSIVSTADGRGRPDQAGRWALRNTGPVLSDRPISREAAVETLAWTLLRRYGVVFRRLLTREGEPAPWRELARVYRRLEARGEIRGGRFVSGMSGEQFALPEAVDHLREIRRSGPGDELVTISAADPLNLTGLITPGDRLRAVAGNRVVYRNGIPLAAMEGDMLRVLSESDPDTAARAAAAAAGRRVPVVSGYVGRAG